MGDCRRTVPSPRGLGIRDRSHHFPRAPVVIAPLTTFEFAPMKEPNSGQPMMHLGLGCQPVTRTRVPEAADIEAGQEEYCGLGVD